MRRLRRNHSPQFEAKVVLTALRGEHTLAELAEQFDAHPNQITQWKLQGVETHRQYRTRDEARADLFDHLERFHTPQMRRRVARRDQEFAALIKPSMETG